MKKTKYFLTILSCFLFNMVLCNAQVGQSISVNKSKIEVGQSVTATVKLSNVAAWNIKVNGTGNTNGCSTSSADATSNGKNSSKSFSVTCSSNSTGVIKITYSGDATSEDGSTVNLSGSKTVTVVAATPKSGNSYLSGLSVDGASISPEFNKDTFEYTATLDAGITKAHINASKADNKASISGIGEVDVIEGDNHFDIVVTAENGNTKTYKLTIVVKEFDPIIVNVDNKSYTLVRKASELVKPDSFIESSIQIGEDTIPAFYNEVLNKTIVGLKNQDGEIEYFEYSDGEYTKYIEFKFNQLNINLIDMPKGMIPKYYIRTTATIFGEEVVVYKLDKNSKFAISYGTDVTTGEKSLYQIDLVNNTIQKYNGEFINKIEDNNKLMIIGFITLGAVVIIEFLLIILISGRKKNKVKKINNNKLEKVKEKAIEASKEDQKKPKIKDKK